MSTSNRDSATVDSTQKSIPPTTDTMTTKMTNPDTIKIKRDSMATSPVK
ncbi:hypothetical protein [Chryseobacterium sp.]